MKKLIRWFVVKCRGSDSIDNESGMQESIRPIRSRKLRLIKKGYTCIEDMLVFSFNPTILLRSLNTRFMMKDNFRSIKGIEQKLRAIITSDIFRSDMILILYKGNEIFNMSWDFRLIFEQNNPDKYTIIIKDIKKVSLIVNRINGQRVPNVKV